MVALPVGLILAGGCIATFVRAGWVLFALALIIWVCSRRKLTTFLMYGTIAVGFTFLFIKADPLLNSLDRLDGVLPDSGDVENQAFRIGTFSDRLISFHNVMSNPAFHTWFGNRNAEELHGNVKCDQAHRRLLREALLKTRPRLSFKEALLRMPDDGDDEVFSRKKRKRRQPRELSAK